MLANRMKAVSYIGFFAMVGLGIGAFAWTDRWWLTALLFLGALSIGWYSLGLFARAETATADRAEWSAKMDAYRQERDSDRDDAA